MHVLNPKGGSLYSLAPSFVGRQGRLRGLIQDERLQGRGARWGREDPGGTKLSSARMGKWEASETKSTDFTKLTVGLS